MARQLTSPKWSKLFGMRREECGEACGDVNPIPNHSNVFDLLPTLFPHGQLRWPIVRFEYTEWIARMIPIILHLASVGKDGGIITRFLFGPRSRTRLTQVWPRSWNACVRVELVVDVCTLCSNLMSAIQHKCCARFHTSGNNDISVCGLSEKTEILWVG